MSSSCSQHYYFVSHMKCLQCCWNTCQNGQYPRQQSDKMKCELIVQCVHNSFILLNLVKLWTKYCWSIFSDICRNIVYRSVTWGQWSVVISWWNVNFVTSDSLICNLNMFREWNKRLTADQAQKMYEQAVKLEQEFSEYFTGVYCVVTIYSTGM